ncbi:MULTISPECIES: ABC transporter ATP-binding protein [unclassified Nocardioides]|uniref:ABC transporter ATP-binding protein n=1 Tax=unclassified Nocardioides TaxID=2615069 RepID=UPI00138F1EEB|nr:MULTISPECIES: ABC transporter ATP-binding protein [unclassified Nocardioides]
MRSLDAGYGSLQVLWDVGLDLSAGEIGVVLGPNGAGKSTLLGAIVGDVKSGRGSVAAAGEDLTRLPSAKRLRSGLGWAPEGRNVFGHLTVRDNLRMSARLAGIRADYDELEAEVFALFPAMEQKCQALAGTLSGGQQQILAISRILVRRPVVALLDEPTIGLAPSIVEKLGEAIESTKASGVSWLIAEQNLAWLSGICERTYVLQGGRIVRVGGSEIIASRDSIREAFFGSNELGLV